MTSPERHYLLDILLEAESAISFVSGLDFESFSADTKTRHAVLHCLMIIGEAAGRITETTTSELPNLAWRKMKGLRNVIVHEYEGVNLPVIWTVVTVELPKIVAALDPLFPERPKP